MTTSSKLVEIAKCVVINAAEIGVEDAGSRLMGSAWPYLKSALKPLFGELEHRYPRFAELIAKPGPDADKLTNQITNDISKDPKLKEAILFGFANIACGQNDILVRIRAIEETLSEQESDLKNSLSLIDKKVDEVASRVEYFTERYSRSIILENFTMYDLEGSWKLIESDVDEWITSSKYQEPKFICGFAIWPIDAAKAELACRWPVASNVSGKFVYTLFKNVDKKVAEDGKDKDGLEFIYVSGPQIVTMNGSLLKIPMPQNFFLAYEVREVGRFLILSAEDDSKTMTLIRDSELAGSRNLSGSWELIRFLDTIMPSFMSYGYEAFEEKNYTKALRWFDRALALDSTNPQLYGYRGAVYHQMKKYDLAVSDYSAAIQYGAENSNHFLNRAFAEIKLEKYREAFVDFKVASRMGSERAQKFLEKIAEQNSGE